MKYGQWFYRVREALGLAPQVGDGVLGFVIVIVIDHPAR